MDDKKITIITAFFPIARENWKGFERSNDKYFEYFEFWARIHNDLIVYTTPEYKKRILKIREKFGHHNTQIITIKDPHKIDPEIYTALQKVAQNQLATNFHVRPKNPESWNADYNYIMLLKYWCLQDSAKNHPISGLLAWVDFGFNHGGEFYTNPNDFHFEWRYNFSDKIHLFQIHNDDGLPIFEVIRRMNTYIQGNVVVATNLCEKLWQSTRENLFAITKNGLMDDDQILLLMLARQHPELCELHKSIWFSMFRDFSHQQFEVKSSAQKNKPKTLKNKLSYRHLINQYFRFWKKTLYKSQTKG